jgi:hypothetical protein
MNHIKIIQELSINSKVYNELLTGLNEDEYLWKSKPEKWCLLEIICHIKDEEQEDFRARTKHVLETPTEPLPSINPAGWVEERKYMQQNFADTLDTFLKEREQSIEWLKSLRSPKWNNTYNHPKFGQMTAKMFLSNWLAHDYLHTKQILKLKFDYLKQLTDETLTYAGDW